MSANAFDKGLDNDVGITPDDFLVKPVRVSELLDWLGRRLNLQWIEADRPGPAVVQSPAAVDSEVLPSRMALQELEDQIHAGYMRGVHKALDRIAGTEPACEPFVQRLRQMARNFQLDTLAHVVSAALAQPESPQGAPSTDAPQAPDTRPAA